MKIELHEQRRKLLTDKIQAYFRTEFDDPIGELKAELLIDFFVEQLGPQIYNQAIADAQTFIQDKLIDLDNILFIPE
ncbi:DUF2164 domain-containing protein [Pelobacter seleniigenes]|uniref:DUF2164 domain-containing protein n=1 Tax=Pelobacter seleniigenes TaxID=407188 RepID=UPI0004A70819|nr:DUF2164 domain-containing protein [Pelobacter seleniigenes]